MRRQRTAEQQQQYELMADKIVTESVAQFGAHQVGHFILASGEHSPEKIDLEVIWQHEPIRRIFGELLAYIPKLPDTDIIVGVPHGGRLWTELVHEITGSAQVRLCKLPERGRGVFDFISETDREMAQQAASATVFEDVVYRGGSAASVRRMLPENCDVDLRAIWNRGEMAPENFAAFRSAQFLVKEHLMAYRPEDCPDHGDYST